MLRQRAIVLGVSGSIAAYKALLLMRLCQGAGAEVRAVLTRSAMRFVAPLSFSAISGHPTITDMWTAAEAGEVSHVETAHLADVLVLAPATADLIARLAVGRADDPLTAIALATTAPWVVAPAMETGMWRNPATASNVETLRSRGARIVEPDSGFLASGRQGAGRMAEPKEIVEAVAAALTPQNLTGQRVVVTAGPTREAIDPVRFLSNGSSGKMGYAVARQARRRGADVCLVSGPTALAPPRDVELIPVTTSEQMLAACAAAVPGATTLIMAAAPADFRPAEFCATKLKKAGRESGMTLHLDRTADILERLKSRTAGTTVVGFAAETDNLVQHAHEKLQRKGLDLIVANDITRSDAGFAADTNEVVLIDRNGTKTPLPIMSKDDVAAAILDRVAELQR